MLITDRDCMIADYAIKSYQKIYAYKGKPYYKDFVVYAYLNCLSEAHKAIYIKEWKKYPYIILFDNIEKIKHEEIYPGKIITSPEGISKQLEDFAENYDQLWSDLLPTFETKYIASVDADFEILNADFYFNLIRGLDANTNAIAASSDYSLDDYVFDTYSQRNLLLKERNHTWFCIYKKQAFELTKISHFYFEEKGEDGQMIAYDSAALFQSALRKAGKAFLDSPMVYYSSFVHYGASSKNKTLNRSNIKYYRTAFILTYKGLLLGKSNKIKRIINRICRTLASRLFKNYLLEKKNERAFIHKHDLVETK